MGGFAFRSLHFRFGSIALRILRGLDLYTLMALAIRSFGMLAFDQGLEKEERKTEIVVEDAGLPCNYLFLY